jgi:copper chaperone CopZ
MIRVTVFTLLFALFFAGATTAQTSEQTSSYDVEGMTCALCPKAIRKSLHSIEGVKNVSIDEDSGRVTITADSDVEAASLKHAIESAGNFTATHLERTDD